MDEYERLRQIGRGAFGQVHLGRRRQDRRHIILKYIAMPEEDTKEVLNEVQVLRLLSHPNIIEYIANFVQDHHLVIVMEYAAGGTLHDYLISRQDSPMEEAQVLHFFSQMLLAVQHIHGLNILHRDLKSENMLLDRERQVLKVGDFGISKILATKTLATTVVGTPCYLSPELCEGKPYNRKSDVWALGCLLYEMVALRRTFEAATLAALVLKILRGSYTPLPPHCSDGLRRLVSQILVLDAARRPTVTQMIAHATVAPHFCRLYTDLGMIPWHAAARPLSMSASQTLGAGRTGALGAVWAVRRPSEPPAVPPADSLWTVTSSAEVALLQLDTEPVGRRLVDAGRGAPAAVCVTAAGHAAIWWLAGGDTSPPQPPQIIDCPAGVTFAQVACGGGSGAATRTVAFVTQRGIVLMCTMTAAPAPVSPQIVQALLGHEVAQVSCGSDHVLAVTSAGAVFSWGGNSDGQLGSGTRRAAGSPSPLALPPGVVASRVRAGNACSLVITADGRLFTCGLNTAGRLGATEKSADGGGKTGERRLRPAAVSLPDPVLDSVPCLSRTAVLTSDGALLWLGGGEAAPVRSPLPAAVSAISGTASAVLALCGGGLYAVREAAVKQPVKLEMPAAGRPRLAEGGLLLLRQ